MRPLIEGAAWALGLALLLFFHFHRLTAMPGLHFDEGWALNHAHEIASSPGSWPLTAMSPYTAPWAHYWGALFLRLFGPSLLVFRLSQLALSLAGQGLLLAALPREKRLPALFFFLFLPGLWLNHRFAIELTGFHVFAFGLALFALARGLPWLALLAALAGTTAHILFYAPALGLLGAVLLVGERLAEHPRRIFALYFLLCAAFFARVLFLIPEKGKGVGLVASALLGAGLLVAQAESWELWRWRGWSRMLRFAAVAAGVNALFFSQGLWSSATYTGIELWRDPLLAGTFAASFLVTAYFAWRGAREWPALWQFWFLLGLLLAGLMMLKPAPRYYELALLGIALLGAYGVAAAGRAQRGLLVFLVGNCLLSSAGPLLFSATPALPLERSFHWLFYRDSSRDFLSKQALAAKLGGMGCKYSDIDFGDSRVREAMLALSWASWPLGPQSCGGRYHIVRRAEAGPADAGGFEYAEFVLRKE